MFFALLGVNKMVSPIPLVETILDEWLEHSMLLVHTVKKRTDMAWVGREIFWEPRRLRVGRHDLTFAP